jgi:hypothetical protein
VPTWRAVKKDTSRRVDSDLLVQVKLEREAPALAYSRTQQSSRSGGDEKGKRVYLSNRQLYSLSDLLLLRIHASNVRVLDVRSVLRSKKGDGGVGLWRKDVDEGVGMTVKSDGGGGLEEFAVEGREDSDDVVASCDRRDGELSS